MPALWCRPVWLRAPLLCLAWAGMLVYGSLIPWHFDFAEAVGHAGRVWAAVVAWITSPAWVPAVEETSSLGVPIWVSDQVTNLLIYVPLGVLLRLTLSRVTGRQLVQVLAGVLLIFGFCWLIEATQSLIPGRYASVQDVIANTLGGTVGVLLGHRVNAMWRGAVFALYRWYQKLLSAIAARVSYAFHGPLVVSSAVAVNVLLLVFWFLYGRGAGPEPGVDAGTVELVPFVRLFDRSYDVAAVLLAQSLLVYCLIGALLMLPLLRGTTRRALGWVVLTVTLSAAGVEALRLIGPGASGADVTEPLLGLIAGGLVLTVGFMAVHACRSACRRQEQIPVTFERRSRPHDYRFALGGGDSRTGRV